VLGMMTFKLDRLKGIGFKLPELGEMVHMQRMSSSLSCHSSSDPGAQETNLTLSPFNFF